MPTQKGTQEISLYRQAKFLSEAVLVPSPEPVRCSQHAPKFVMIMINAGCKWRGGRYNFAIYIENFF